MSERTRLSQLTIASPCPEDWSAMSGDDRVRHCGRCDRAVYDLSTLRRDEADALLEAHGEAPLCVRYYERQDGMIMTADCTHRQRRRLLEGTAVVLVLAAAGFSIWRQYGQTVRMGGVGRDEAWARETAPATSPEGPLEGLGRE